MKNVPELRFDGYEREWEEKILGNCIKLLKSGLSRKLSDFDIGVPVVRANNTFDNKLDMDNDVKYWYEDDPQGANTDNYAIQKNDILINFINSKSKMGTAAIVKKIPNRKTIYTTNIMRLVVSDDLNPYYFLMITLTTSYRKYIEAISMPAVNQYSFTTLDYKKLKFNSPCIDEQEKIGELFKKIDALIEKQEGKVSKLEDFKKSMLQKMFPKKGELVPEFRFDGFDGEWYIKKAYDILVKNNKKNKDLYIDYVESVSNKFGFIKQTDQFEGYQLASADLSNYYVIEPYCFAYNPSRINVGSIAYKDKNGTTSVVSPLYVSFTTNSEINDYFIWYLFKTYQFEQQRQSYAEGGVRDTLSFASLSEFKFVIPTKKEQQKIGQFFKNLDTQIETEEKLLESYKQMKKSLLQKMFV